MFDLNFWEKEEYGAMDIGTVEQEDILQGQILERASGVRKGIGCLFLRGSGILRKRSVHDIVQ